MNMKKIFYFLFAVLILLGSCAKDEHENLTGNVTGVVFDGSGEPKQSVQVNLVAGSAYNENTTIPPPPEKVVSSFVTGADGVFSFNNLKAGLYYINVYIGEQGGWSSMPHYKNVGVTLSVGKTINCDIRDIFYY